MCSIDTSSPKNDIACAVLILPPLKMILHVQY